MPERVVQKVVSMSSGLTVVLHQHWYICTFSIIVRLEGLVSARVYSTSTDIDYTPVISYLCLQEGQRIDKQT